MTASTAVISTPAPETPRPRPTLPSGFTIAIGILAALTTVAIFLVAYVGIFSALQEQRAQRQHYGSLRALLDPSSPEAPAIGGAIRPGTPVAVMNAPAIGIRDLVIVEGSSSGDLAAGPGHLRASPLPGQVGESIVIGKSVSDGAPFSDIATLARGASITVTTGQGTFHYAVSDVRTAGQQLPPIPTGGSLLTLVTSQGHGWLGALAPDHLIYVDAVLRGTPVAAPDGRPIAVPAAEYPGGSDISAWPLIVLWLELLLVGAAAGVWLWFRWGRWQAWLITAPVLFGLLWAASAAAVRLLPNVY